MDEPELRGELVVAPMPSKGRWLVVYRVGDRVLYSDSINIHLDKARRKFVAAALKDAQAPEFDAMLEVLQEEAGNQASRTVEAQRRAAEQSAAKLAEAKAAAVAAGDETFDEAQWADKLDKVDSGGKRAEVRAQLVSLVLEEPEMEVFLDSTSADATAYVSHVTAVRRVTWPVRSSEFRRWLLRAYKKKYGDVPSSTDLADGIHAIAAIPDENTPTQEVFVRVAGHDGETWIDLSDDSGKAIKITAKGWSIVPGRDVPVRFVRKQGMMPLPVPRRGGTILALRRFIVGDKNDQILLLLVAFLVSAMRPNGPYSILVASGQQGSAKSTLCKLVRKLIDPHRVLLRLPVRDERNLMIAAQNGWIVGFDNVSVLSAALSDSICSLATGGGFGARKLYTDDEEKLIGLARATILNGIGEVVTRGDALDRSIILVLRRIEPHERRSERKLWARFDKLAPYILGALLDGQVSALKNLGTIKFTELPRMADQAEWLAAAEPGLGLKPGTFERVLAANVRHAQLSAIEASPIGSALLQLMQGEDRWEGTYADLLAALKQRAEGWVGHAGAEFPRNPWALRQALIRLNPSLGAERLQVVFGRRTPDIQRSRLVVVERVAEKSSNSSSLSSDGAGEGANVDAGGQPLDNRGQARAEDVHAATSSGAVQRPTLDRLDRLDKSAQTTLGSAEVQSHSPEPGAHDASDAKPGTEPSESSGPSGFDYDPADAADDERGGGRRRPDDDEGGLFNAEPDEERP